MSKLLYGSLAALSALAGASIATSAPAAGNDGDPAQTFHDFDDGHGTYPATFCTPNYTNRGAPQYDNYGHLRNDSPDHFLDVVCPLPSGTPNWTQGTWATHIVDNHPTLDKACHLFEHYLYGPETNFYWHRETGEDMTIQDETFSKHIVCRIPPRSSAGYSYMRGYQFRHPIPYRWIYGR